MISYEEGRIVYEDSELEIRPSPNDPEGYTLHIKDSHEYLSFPRDTLEEIALVNREKARDLIASLMPPYIQLERILERNKLNCDSIIVALIKAHINEEKRKSEL